MATQSFAVSRAADLRALLDADGPHLSVALRTGPADESAREETLLRWRVLRQDAEVQGAPEPLLGQVDDRVEAIASHQTGHLFLATPAGIAVDEPSAVPPLRDEVSWQALPALTPVLASRQYLVPHLVVLVDRLGADIGVIDEHGSRLVVDDGDDHPIRKVAGGGWSQRRFQQRAEETWEHNAAAVAEDVDRLATTVNPAFVLLGGDVRAVELLRERIRNDVADRIVPTGATRAVDGSAEQVTTDRMAALDAHQQVLDAELLAQLAEQHGNDRAAAGDDEVTAALRSAEVDTLAVHPRLDGPLGWFDELPHVATEPGLLVDLGHEPRSAPLQDVAVAAAITTGADVRILGTHALDRNLAAVLRW